MEPIGQITPSQTLKRSQSQQTSTQTTNLNIPRETHAAIFAVLNKVRLLNGWTVRTAAELDPTIRVWFEALNEYKIPTHAYNELYKRAFDVRQTRMQLGSSNAPTIDAALMVAQWTGPNGLEAELRQREQNSGPRRLSTTSSSQCLRCYGTGVEIIYGENGEKIGARPGCQHEHIDTEDPHAEGIEKAIESLKPVDHDETADEICKRLHTWLRMESVTADAGADTTQTDQAEMFMRRVGKYCRENPN